MIDLEVEIASIDLTEYQSRDVLRPREKMVQVYRMYLSVKKAAWWMVLKVVGQIWGTAFIAGYG